MPLQDSDNFIIGRSTGSYKITYQDLKDDLNYVPPPPPIVVGKGVITPSTDVEAGNTLTGSATVTDAVNPVEVHVWELNGTEDQRGTSATYIAKEGTVRYRKEVTDDNNSTPEIGAWSNPVTVTKPSGPTATMHGLRFDGARDTSLIRGSDVSGSWTFSCWVKYTAPSGTPYLITNGSQGIAIGKDNNELRYWNGSAITYLSENGAIQKNTWIHVCVTYDGTKMTGYVNNVSKSGDVASAPFNSTIIGKVDNTNKFNGYMSDCYFVDGKAAPPETFGQSFDGKWAPLDSVKVKENIDAVERQQPYDSRANTSQVWSASGWGSNARDAISNAFDGDLTTSLRPNVDSTLVWNTNIPLGTGELAFYGTTGGNRTDQLTFTDSDGNTAQAASPKYPDEGWVTVSGLSGNLVKVEIEQQTGFSDPSVRAFKVDGRLLVDQGVWNVSQNWSGGSVAGATNAAGPWSNAFDGDFTSNCWATPGGTSTLTLSTPLSYTSGVEVRGYLFPQGSFGASSISVNGSEASGFPEGDSDNTATWVTVLSGSGTLTSIASTNYGLIQAVKVDGEILVDAGAQWDTSQTWSDLVTANKDIVLPLTNGFDGDLSTHARIEQDAPGFMGYTLTIPTGVTNQEIEIHSSGNSSAAFTIEVNNVETGRDDSDTGHQFISGGNVSAGDVVKFGRTTTTSSGSCIFAAVRLGGKLLVDAYGPGFGDNGFYLPFDPAETGKNYSAQTVGTFETGASKSIWFDGDTSTRDRPKGNGSEVVCTLSSSIDNVTSVEAYTAYPSGNPSLEDGCFLINGSVVEATEKVQLGWTKLPINGTLNSFGTKTVDDSDGGNYVLVAGWKVNGKLLVDHSSIGVDDSGNDNHFHDENFVLSGQGQDTVLDTPMKNYAVLESGSNGNLVASADGTNLTYVGESGTDYYYEADGTGAVHTGGSAFSSTTGVAYNFGQQPFVGTPTAEGRLYQEWAEYARTALGYAVDRIAKLEQRNIQLEALVEEARTRLAALELNEVSDDAVDTALITLIGNINDRLTVLEGGN